MAQRELCDHFRGEEPYSPQRKVEIARALEQYCKGTDAWLAALKQKYENCPAIETRLAPYDPSVERHAPP